MMNKKAIEFSFAWMFAIIVGAVVIFLAIFATTKLIGSEREISDTELSQSLGILFTPIETSSEDIKDPGAPIKLSSETRIYNDCSETGMFGRQEIRLATKSGFGKPWGLPGLPKRLMNKYIFSQNVSEGTTFYIFSKPFKMPFKVADAIYLWTGKYCFVNPPEAIRKEMSSLGSLSKVINITSSISSCDSKSTKVCFSSMGQDCNIRVYDNRVEKGAIKMYYGKLSEDDTALIYAAIFASPKIYECQLKRLMKRTSEVAKLSAKKSEILTGCKFETLYPNLITLSDMALSLNNSQELLTVISGAGEVGRINENLNCPLF